MADDKFNKELAKNFSEHDIELMGDVSKMLSKKEGKKLSKAFKMGVSGFVDALGAVKGFAEVMRSNPEGMSKFMYLLLGKNDVLADKAWDTILMIDGMARVIAENGNPEFFAINKRMNNAKFDELCVEMGSFLLSMSDEEKDELIDVALDDIDVPDYIDQE